VFAGTGDNEPISKALPVVTRDPKRLVGEGFEHRSIGAGERGSPAATDPKVT